MSTKNDNKIVREFKDSAYMSTQFESLIRQYIQDNHPSTQAWVVANNSKDKWEGIFSDIEKEFVDYLISNYQTDRIGMKTNLNESDLLSHLIYLKVSKTVQKQYQTLRNLNARDVDTFNNLSKNIKPAIRQYLDLIDRLGRESTEETVAELAMDVSKLISDCAPIIHETFDDLYKITQHFINNPWFENIHGVTDEEHQANSYFPESLGFNTTHSAYDPLSCVLLMVPTSMKDTDKSTKTTQSLLTSMITRMSQLTTAGKRIKPFSVHNEQAAAMDLSFLMRQASVLAEETGNFKTILPLSKEPNPDEEQQPTLEDAISWFITEYDGLRHDNNKFESLKDLAAEVHFDTQLSFLEQCSMMMDMQIDNGMLNLLHTLCVYQNNGVNVTILAEFLSRTNVVFDVDYLSDQYEEAYNTYPDDKHQLMQPDEFRRILQAQKKNIVSTNLLIGCIRHTVMKLISRLMHESVRDIMKEGGLSFQEMHYALRLYDDDASTKFDHMMRHLAKDVDLTRLEFADMIVSHSNDQRLIDIRNVLANERGIGSVENHSASIKQ